MIQAIIYKEWLKTRLTFLICLTGTALLTLYAILAMNRIATLKGVNELWLTMLTKGETFINILTYVPLAAGIAIGISQMAPETASKRLKLTLHLPYSNTRMTAVMLGAGVAEVLALCFVYITAIAVYDYTVFAPEMASTVLLTALPWSIAGIAAYMFTAAVCLEGTWRQRTILALTGIGFTAVFFMAEVPAAYGSMILPSIIIAVALAMLSMRSIFRFKEGRQD